ncbi:hypothetical protein HZA56_14150 [Candidatus Poribacteria bacterium]|nr:hypothetical protein [Candidatus Poribacteria bacterium]
MEVAIIVGVVVFVIIFIGVVFGGDPRRECPKLMLGYNRCNRWKDQDCDHSEEAFASARRVYESNLIAEREFWKEYDRG